MPAALPPGGLHDAKIRLCLGKHNVGSQPSRWPVERHVTSGMADLARFWSTSPQSGTTTNPTAIRLFLGLLCLSLTLPLLAYRLVNCVCANCGVERFAARDQEETLASCVYVSCYGKPEGSRQWRHALATWPRRPSKSLSVPGFSYVKYIPSFDQSDPIV